MEKQTNITSGDTRQELLLFIGLLALSALIFGGIVFFKPVTRVIADDLTYIHHGTFGYTAKDRDNIYDSDTIVTGEPVYLQLVCDVAMNFSYHFIAPRMKPVEGTELQGTYLINAQITDIDGWKRSFQLIHETEFQGAEFETQMDFDICQAQALILDKETKTETKNRWYSLFILPEIKLSGSIVNQPLDTVYLPRVEFQIDSNILRLPEGIDSLALDQEGSLENVRVVSNTISLFGQEINIILARRIALITMGFSLAAAALPGWSLYKDMKKSDISRIQVQYHPLLMDVQAGSQVFPTEQVVDVVSFSDLIKMAERYGAMILHEAKGSFHRYSVQDEQTVYQYTIDVFKEQTLFPNITKFKRSLLYALETDQLELYYQPVFRVKENAVAEVEAFIRWNHAEYGILYPADFISHAEECNLLPEIDRWVFRKVCQQLRTWIDEGFNVLPVSINLAPETILDSAFISEISEMVVEKLCDPGTLQIEINRSNQVYYNDEVPEHLSQLSALGIRIAIDNFASDSANQINQVLHLPIKSLKIERTVLQGISENEENQRLLSAVVGMAKSLQIELVAQGVETQADLDFVKKLDIDMAQGFFLGKPVRASELIPLLKKPAPKKKAKRSKK
ncbi:MAG: EAL domain-containing protein [Chloroflexi bacterium]|nr:EAL domain-containing protein [Chloroflexota bacterium]